MENNYSVTNIGTFKNLEKVGRVMVGDDLKLTGCEISFNCLHKNTGSPFVHSHELNEEVYIIVKGEGIFYADGHEFEIHEGSVIRVAPFCERALKADKNHELTYICIQVQAGSLTQATQDDGVLSESLPSWMADDTD